MAITADFRMFPPVPNVQAMWAPLYIEPMHGSGERIVIATVAVDGSGAFHVHATLSGRVLQCMYGDRAEVLDGLIGLAVDVLQAYLATGGALDSWVPPFRSCHLGSCRTAMGADLEQIARSGAILTSSLAAKLAESSVEQTSESVGTGLDIDRWVQQIRDRVCAQSPHLDARFNGEVVVRKGAAPTRIGYLGERIAANFDMLIPGSNLSTRRIRSKSRLVDLQILKDQLDVLAPRTTYELLLWIPDKDSPGYSQRQLDAAHGALSELEAFADEHSLMVRPYSRAEDAAQRILKAELV
ncbi:hypothetical protein [Stenotrophomonas lactitubi]|uniref:hypothetical protein n=1 Tax=Stenotrophomonas lactitubi TaxID=2045214 RepID=UPI00320AFFBB